MATVAELRMDVDSRSVKRAEQDLDRLEGQADKTERSAERMGRAVDRAGDHTERMGRRVDGATRKMGGLERAVSGLAVRAAAAAGAMAGVAAAAAAFGAVRVGAGFEEQMSAVLAITQASGAEFDALSAKARELGASTVFSAQEAAEGMEFLARAGFNAEQIIGALPGTLDLAAAGALELGSAADIASNVLTGFGLAAEEAGRVSDVLAKAAASSNTNVQQLGEGLKFVAPIAAGLGVSMEETTAAIGKLSDAGLQASVAGTGLRRILSELASPSAELRELLGGLSLETDGFTAVMDHLARQTISTGEALEIFGDRGGPAFTVLLEAFRDLDSEGVSALQRLSTALEEADGFASETAKTMTDNFNGAVKQARSALEELFITAATDSGALEGLTEVVEELTAILRSDAAKEFAQGFGEGFLSTINAAGAGVQYLTDVFTGLSVVIKEVGDDIATFLGLDIIRRLGELEGVRAAAFDAAGNLVNPADPVLDLLAAIGENAREAKTELKALEDTTPVQIGVVTNIDDITAAVGTAEERAAAFEARMAEIGEGTALGGLLRGFDNFNKHLVAANDNAQAVKDTIDSIKPPEVGAIQQALLDQVAIAERLAEAAKGGKIAFEIELNDVELDRLAQQAVDKAKEAGEDLSFATARILVGQIDGLEKAAQAMLDAEEALRDRASDRADEIADGLLSRISSFENSFSRLDPTNRTVIAAFEKQLQALSDEIDETSIGLNTEQLEEVYDALEQVGINWRQEVTEGFNEGAENVRRSIEYAFGNAIDDLIFNGGRGLGDQFDRLLRDAANDNFIDPISKALSGDGSILGNIKGAFDKQSAGFANAFGDQLGGVLNAAFSGFQGFEIGKGLSETLGLGGNKTSVAAGGVAGGLVGSAIGGPIGAAIGSALGAVIGNLFSKPSDRTAQTVFRADTGQNFGRAQDGTGADANAQVRNALEKSITDLTTNVFDLIGGRITGGSLSFLNLAVKSDRKTGESFFELGRQGPGGIATDVRRFDATEAGGVEAATYALELMLERVKGGEEPLLRYAQAALKAGEDLDTVVSGLSALSEVFKSFGESDGALRAYANAAIDAGRSAQEIVDGLNAYKSVLDLTKEPLSDVAQGLKNIDDATNPVIDDLKSLGLSIAGITAAAQEAGRAIGTSFIDGVKDLNLRLKNDTLADYKEVLDAIAQRQTDAFALLERGFITQGEFDFVQSTGGLQAAQFFKGLDDEARNNLAAYLGILGEVSGDIAVKRAQLEEQFDYLIDNVEQTAGGFEEAARNFERLGQGLRQTAEQIRTQFSGLTPRANVDELLGRVSVLRTEGLQGNTSALEALPQVVTSLVQSARQAFGGTAEFARIRDIGLAALDDTAGLAEQLAKQNFEAAENARADVKLLSDIRNLIDDERQLTTLQGILDSGRLTNQLIAEQLQAFVNLFGQDGRPANEVSIEDLQAAATQAIFEQQRIAAETSPAPSATTTNAAASSAQSSDTQLAQAIQDNATAIERLAAAMVELGSDFDDLASEIRQDLTRRAS